MTALDASLRPLRLAPWLVRAVIPLGCRGTYALRRDRRVMYVGRSDDLRRRLIEHALSGRADYFTFDIHSTSVQAYEVESALFHILFGAVANQIHPAAPALSGVSCPFCQSTAIAALTQRVDIRSHPQTYRRGTTGTLLDHNSRREIQ